MKPLIYAVEDDLMLQELYLCALQNEFDCRCFGGGEVLFDAIADAVPDLVLLDIMLPGAYDGLSILSRLKSVQNTAHTPVIMVSAKGDEVSKVKGLNMGADDYLAKPFGVMELIARIKAHLRRGAKPAADNITYRNIKIDFLKRQITAAGNLIHTSLKEYNLLCMLCQNAEKVCEREAIFTEVWGGNFAGETRTLDIHIKELRKKLAEAGSEAVIQTIRGVGYMLT